MSLSSKATLILCLSVDKKCLSFFKGWITVRKDSFKVRRRRSWDAHILKWTSFFFLEASHMFRRILLLFRSSSQGWNEHSATFIVRVSCVSLKKRQRKRATSKRRKPPGNSSQVHTSTSQAYPKSWKEIRHKSGTVEISVKSIITDEELFCYNHLLLFYY